MKERDSKIWQVPYLPIDPADIGRVYEPVVRINSQSGKGGVAFIMDTYYGFKLPKGMHKEFADKIQVIAEAQGEVAPEQIMSEFRKEYLDKKEPLHFRRISVGETHKENDEVETQVELVYTDRGIEKALTAAGNGPIDAVLTGLRRETAHTYKVLDYTEHSLGLGENAQAAAYIHMLDTESGATTFGVGISSNITRASIRGIFSAINRLQEKTK